MHQISRAYTVAGWCWLSPNAPLVASRGRGRGMASLSYLRTLQGRERRITSNAIRPIREFAAYISGVDYYKILAFAGGRTMVEQR